MDDNTREVLTTLIQVGGGLVTGVIVALVGFRHARRLERERWDREDRIRQRDRWKSETREVLARHAACCERLVAAGLRQDGHEAVAAHTAVNASLAEVRMLAPRLDEEATAAYFASAEMFSLQLGGTVDVPARDAYVRKLRAFVDAASADLLARD